MTPAELVLLAARADLACYALAQWPGFELAAHHCLMADRLESVEREDSRRFDIHAPASRKEFAWNSDISGVVFGLFFNSDQRFCVQILIFSSSRSSARPMGR